VKTLIWCKHYYCEVIRRLGDILVTWIHYVDGTSFKSK